LRSWKADLGDFLDVLAKNAHQTINDGYYNVKDIPPLPKISLKEAIELKKRNPVIAEIKTVSPSMGTIRNGVEPIEVAKEMKSSGAIGISVLTEPRNFGGDLKLIHAVKKSVRIPVLMKDIIMDHRQIEAASMLSADAILLIKALFDRGHCGSDLNEMIKVAHDLGLEVLLETHTADEFRSAIQSEADLVGINNRDLRSLEVDLGVTERILKEVDAFGRIIVSESGIRTPEDIRFLRARGAHAFLIGSAIMSSEDIGEAVRRFVNA